MIARMCTTLVVTAAVGVAPAAMAAEGSDECGSIRFAQVNWTGVSAKTETAAWMLDKLGYDTEVVTASVPLMFQSLATDERDVAMGLWLPTQRDMVRKYMVEGSIDRVVTNLKGAKYTIGVNQAAWEGGVKSFSDLDDNKEKFNGKIYGIEAGNDGNKIVKSMIDDDAYGLGDWKLVPSSEAGMLSQVRRAVDNDKWVAWLAWAPHPMNINFDMKFLKGGAKYWGPNQGGATVHTLTREGFAWQCPNVGQFLQNYTFTVEEQAQMGNSIINEDMGYAAAGKALIKEKPKLLERWFGHGEVYKTHSVKTRDGEQEAKKAIRAALDL